MLRLNPLLATDTGPVAWSGGRPVQAGEFIDDLARLAPLLPDQGHMVNLCDDRYMFLLGLAGAMERLQVNLLMPNRTAELILSISEQLPDLYLLCDRPLDPSLAALGLPAVDTNDLLARGDTRYRPQLAWPPEQTLALAFTSGSTGVPKPNRKTWQCLSDVAAMTARAMGLDSGPPGTVVATVPAQHMYGLEASVMLPLQAGWALSAARPFFPADIEAELAAVPGPRILITTPVHIRALLQEQQELPALQLIISATAPLSTELAKEAEQRYSAPVMEIFGFTEVGSAATRRSIDDAPWQLLDRLRFTDFQGGTAIVAPYFEEPVPISDVIDRIDDRRFYLRGRDSDMVNIAGKRASLADLNLKLGDIDGVVDGVLVMPEHQVAGVARLMAFVVAPGCSAMDIAAALRQRLDPVFVPRPIVMLDRLPRNDTGKLPRHALEELMRRHAGDREAADDQ